VIGRSLLRFLLVAAGSLSLALGVIGIFLPVLPTTPFLLLSAFFYLRGSERLHHWLLHHRILGRPLREYLHYRAVRRRNKVGALVLLWTTLLVSILLVNLLWVRLLLVAVGIAVSLHVGSLRTLRPEEREDTEPGEEP